MKRTDDILSIYRIANYYYNENLSQNEIALKEKVSRSQISRLLIKARELGLVSIKVELPSTISDHDLEEQLEKALALKKVIVVSTNIDENNAETATDLILAVSTAASAMIPSLIADSQYIGIGWGRTLYNISLMLPVTQSVTGRVFIPLVGNSGMRNKYLQTTSIVNRFAERFMSSGFYLNFPYVHQKNTVSTAYEEACINQLDTYWNNLDTAIYSLGIIPTAENLYIDEIPKTYVDTKDLENSCGEILGQSFSQDGSFHWIGLEGFRFIGISLSKLREIRNVICVASGIEKVIPIISSARNGFFKTLIIDDLTARVILDSL